MKHIVFLLSIVCIIDFNSCTSEKKSSQVKEKETNALFTKLTSEKTGIEFVNKVVNKKDFNIFRYRNFYNGGGVAIGDLDSEGYDVLDSVTWNCVGARHSLVKSVGRRGVVRSLVYGN